MSVYRVFFIEILMIFMDLDLEWLLSFMRVLFWEASAQNNVDNMLDTCDKTENEFH
jgi:hypothetical protein